MAKYMWEFNVGDRIKNWENVVVEILQKYKNGNIKFRVVDNDYSRMNDFTIGSIHYLKNCDDSCVRGADWELVEESPKNISPESIKELEKSIQKEKSNLNEFVENTRRNISDMEKSLEKLKKTANKVPTIVVGEMYSYNNSEETGIVAVCLRHEPCDNSWCMLYMDYSTEDLKFEWIYDKEFGEEITEFTHLNTPEQKKIAAGFYAFYTGNIPGV